MFKITFTEIKNFKEIKANKEMVSALPYGLAFVLKRGDKYNLEFSVNNPNYQKTENECDQSWGGEWGYSNTDYGKDDGFDIVLSLFYNLTETVLDEFKCKYTYPYSNNGGHFRKQDFKIIIDNRLQEEIEEHKYYSLFLNLLESVKFCELSNTEKEKYLSFEKEIESLEKELDNASSMARRIAESITDVRWHSPKKKLINDFDEADFIKLRDVYENSYSKQDLINKKKEEFESFLTLEQLKNPFTEEYDVMFKKCSAEDMRQQIEEVKNRETKDEDEVIEEDSEESDSIDNVEAQGVLF